MLSFLLTFRVDTVLLIFPLKFCKLDIEILNKITRRRKIVNIVKEEEKIVLGGESTEGGIKIYESKYKIESCTKRFKKNVRALLQLLPLIIFIIGITFAFIEILNWGESIVYWQIFFSVAIFVVVIAYILGHTFLDRQAEEWHAAEHKLIYVLENGSKLTLQSLIDAPMFSKIRGRCGDNNEGLREPSKEKLERALELGNRYLSIKEKLK